MAPTYPGLRVIVGQHLHGMDTEDRAIVHEVKCKPWQDRKRLRRDETDIYGPSCAPGLPFAEIENAGGRTIQKIHHQRLRSEPDGHSADETHSDRCPHL